MFVIYDILAVGFLIKGNERPNDIQKSAVLSIISEAARADYEGATTLLINGEDASQMTPEELKAAIIGGILNGLKVSATVNKDFAEGTSTLITSGNINISAEANLSVTFGDKDTEGAIEIPLEGQSLYLVIKTANITLKSSNTNLNATIGEEKYELTLDANINNKNVKSAITEVMEVLASAGTGEINYAQIIDIVFDALGGENAFDLQLNGTRIQVRPIIDIVNGSQAG